MEIKKKMTLNFYQNLGKLFYAIAASDNKVNYMEFIKLKEVVRTQWIHVKPFTDDFGEDAVHQIEMALDLLNNEENLDAESNFNDFVNYKNQQKHLFTPSVKELIIKTARAVAISFSGINKSELIMLAKLDLELKK